MERHKRDVYNRGCGTDRKMSGMMDVLSERSKHAVSAIREDDLLAEKLRKQGKEVIKLNIGDPAAYFKTPEYIIDAYIGALKKGHTSYSDSIGIPELRQAVAKKYREGHGADFTGDDVVVTQGVSEALAFINEALINPGENAVFFTPYYAPYISYLRIYGGDMIEGYYMEDQGWDIDIDSLEKKLKNEKRQKRAKYLIIANPNNPTGTVLGQEALKRLVETANNHDLILISDEIYDEIVFNGKKFTSIAKLATGAPHIIVHGASKCYDSTGFRLGFIIVPGEDKVSMGIKSSMRNMADLRLSSNTPAQYAIAEGLNNTTEHKKAIGEMVKKIEDQVNFAVGEINKSNFMKTVVPNGAFYIFPKLNMEKLDIKNDKEFVEKLLEEEQVQLARGSGFGAEGHIRLVALADKQTLKTAIERIEGFCERHSK